MVEAFHAAFSLLDTIDQVQRNFLNKLGVSEQEAFRNHNFASSSLRRDIFVLSTSVPAVAQSNAAATATGKKTQAKVCIYTIQIRGPREEGPARGRARKGREKAEGGRGKRVSARARQRTHRMTQ